MSTPEQLGSLNAPQRRAVTYGEPLPGGKGFRAGPLLIVAGAGTGKTNTLARRVAHLLLNRVSPERILLLTFTRRAAQEMLRRAERITTETLRSRPNTAAFPANATRLMWSGTFHAVGNRLLREYAHTLGLDPSFSVIDRGDAADLMDFLRQELGLTRKEKRFPRKDTCLAIYSHRVNTRHSLQQTLDDAFPWCSEWADDLARLYRHLSEAEARHADLFRELARVYDGGESVDERLAVLARAEAGIVESLPLLPRIH